MIKKVFLAAVLLLMVSGLQAQKKLFDKAMKNGRHGLYYVIDNSRKKRNINESDLYKYAFNNDYLIGNVEYQYVNKFGEMTTLLETFEFIPRLEYYELAYSSMPVEGKIPFSELKQVGSAYLFRGIANFDGSITDYKSQIDMVNFSYLLEYNFKNAYYFIRIDSVFWSGNIKNGKLDGTGVAFGKMENNRNNLCFFLKGTFENGFPVGQNTFYWYEGSRFKNFDSYKTVPQSFSLSHFENGKAYFEGDGTKGYIDSHGYGKFTEEYINHTRNHTIAWSEKETEKHRTVERRHYFQFNEPLNDTDRTTVLNILKNDKIYNFNGSQLLNPNTYSIPHFYVEDYNYSGRKWSKEWLTEVLANIKKYPGQLMKNKSLDSVLYAECRRHGMLYEYALLTKNSALLSDKERATIADSIFFQMHAGTIIDKYLSFFPNRKYKGRDLKVMAEREALLTSSPNIIRSNENKTEQTNDEKWVQAYIDNAHDMLERNDEDMWFEWNIENMTKRNWDPDITKTPILTEHVGRYITRGKLGLAGKDYVFRASGNYNDWFPDAFRSLKKAGIKKIDEAIKYRTLLEGIALANKVNGIILNLIRKDESYFNSVSCINKYNYSTHRERMRDAIDVAHEFAATKPELAPACRKADSLITKKMEAIEQAIRDVDRYWAGVRSDRVANIRADNCEKCKIREIIYPYVNEHGIKENGRIYLENGIEIGWNYEKDGKVSGYGKYSGLLYLNTLDKLKETILIKCKEEYCK